MLNNIVLKNWAVYETRLFICNVLAGFRVNHALQTSELRNFDMLIHFVDSISHLSKNSIYNSFYIYARNSLYIVSYFLPFFCIEV